MQLDNTRLVIRERDFLELLDLSLQLIRELVLPWIVITLCMAVPLAILNARLLDNRQLPGNKDVAQAVVRSQTSNDAKSLYALQMLALVLFEIPLAMAPLTLYLGHVAFEERPPARKIFRDLLRSLPQLLLFQVLIRGLIFLPVLIGSAAWALVLLWWLPFASWPFLNEVILLERNPLMMQRGRITTWQRSQSLHSGGLAANLGRWMMSILFALAMTAGLTLTAWYFWTLITHHKDAGYTLYVYCLPVGMWLVASFFTVARYLCYVDLRIRREGWEIELLLRAEADRLARQIA